ncbi:MAG TPA: MFS transporter [Kofleriaceae bacterium]|nr:MFS transporter [Kofleriaceae bacterium]
MSSSSRGVAVYFACQALAASTTTLLVTVSGLVGAMLVADARLATLPAALQGLATLLTTYPASQLMARAGRRAGFSLGALLGCAGAAAATLGIVRGSFVVYCAGTTLIGGHAGFATFYRFAAAESAAPGRRDRAVGWVMSAGVLAALLGPWLAGRTRDLGSSAFAGSFVLVLAMAAAALVVLQLLGAPAVVPVAAARRASLRDVAGAPAFLAVVAAAMVSGAVMVFVMTATPLAMTGCHHAFDRTAHVIQWHVVAMFAPSLVTGRLVARYGAPPVLLAGLGLCAVAAVVNASGTTVAHFQIGLFVLGLGWNLAFIAATTALARVAVDERATAQGLNDLLVFSAQALASLLAGVVEHTLGWRAVNLGVLPLVAAAGIAIWLRLRARPAPAIAAGNA